jgi:GNAT superfamily N-acetyltransferase
MTAEHVNVRLAGLEDVDAVAEAVTAAFANDPAWSFIVGTGNPGAMNAFARALLIPRINGSTAWITDDCTTVAMWDRRAVPGPLDDEDAWWAAFRVEVGEDIWARLDAYDKALEARAPAEPYWYLGVLATHPDHQGRGLATAVLQPGLAAADHEGWDCWLETSTPANKTFYAGRGFTEGIAIDVPGGPPTWWLRRPARAAAE